MVVGRSELVDHIRQLVFRLAVLLEDVLDGGSGVLPQGVHLALGFRGPGCGSSRFAQQRLQLRAAIVAASCAEPAEPGREPVRQLPRRRPQDACRVAGRGFHAGQLVQDGRQPAGARTLRPLVVQMLVVSAAALGFRGRLAQLPGEVGDVAGFGCPGGLGGAQGFPRRELRRRLLERGCLFPERGGAGIVVVCLRLGLGGLLVEFPGAGEGGRAALPGADVLRRGPGDGARRKCWRASGDAGAEGPVAADDQSRGPGAGDSRAGERDAFQDGRLRWQPAGGPDRR